MWGCFLMSGVKILHFLKDWWKSIPIHPNYTMALRNYNHFTDTPPGFNLDLMYQIIKELNLEHGPDFKRNVCLLLDEMKNKGWACLQLKWAIDWILRPGRDQQWTPSFRRHNERWEDEACNPCVCNHGAGNILQPEGPHCILPLWKHEFSSNLPLCHGRSSTSGRMGIESPLHYVRWGQQQSEILRAVHGCHWSRSLDMESICKGAEVVLHEWPTSSHQDNEEQCCQQWRPFQHQEPNGGFHFIKFINSVVSHSVCHWHWAPARGFDPRGESDSPFSPNVNANHQPREAGLTRLFCPSKKVGFDPRAGSDTAIFCSVNRKPSLPRRLIANFRWRSCASFELLRTQSHTLDFLRTQSHTLRIVYREMLSISYVQGVRHIHTGRLQATYM